MVWNTVRNSWKPSGRRSRTRRSRLIFANDRSRACRVILIMHERLDVQPRQLVAALEEIELNDELEADDFAAQLADQLRHRRRSPASGEHVIDNQDATADFDGVAMDLQHVGAVFELIFDALRRRGELPGLAHGDESGAQRIGHGGGEDKAAGLDADHGVDRLSLGIRTQAVDDAAQPLSVLQQRGDVVKQNARLGKIRHFADQTFQMVHGREFQFYNTRVSFPSRAVEIYQLLYANEIRGTPKCAADVGYAYRFQRSKKCTSVRAESRADSR